MEMEMEQFKQHAGIRQGTMQCGSVGQSASCLWFGDSDSDCEDLHIVSFDTISDTFYRTVEESREDCMRSLKLLPDGLLRAF